MVPTIRDRPHLEQQLARTQALIAEGARVIKEQTRLVAELQAKGEFRPDDDHTLDVMIKLQAAHIAYQDKLKKQIESLRGNRF